MARPRSAAVAIFLAVAVVAVGASVAAVATKRAPPRTEQPILGPEVQVTAFAKLDASGSFGPRIITLDSRQAVAVMKTLHGLKHQGEAPSPLICSDDPVLYKIVVHPNGGHSTPYTVRAWRCETTVAEFVGGRRTITFNDSGCTLLRVVQRVLPPHEAEGTLTAPCVRHRVPTVVGETLTAAQTTLSAEGNVAHVGITAEVVDSSVPPETVLSETRGHWPLVPVRIAVPGSSPCTASQLAVTFTGVNNGASQHLFASFTVRDVSAQWCRFDGPVRVVGLNATGAAVTTTVSDTVSTAAPDELSPDTPPIPAAATTSGLRSGQFYPVGVFWGWIGISGHDICEPGTTSTRQVTPATWLVVLPGTVTLTTPNGGSRPLSTCQGVLETPFPTGSGASVMDGQGPRLQR